MFQIIYMFIKGLEKMEAIQDIVEYKCCSFFETE